MKLFGKMLLPLLLIFISVNAFILLTPALWLKYHIDQDVLIYANLIFLLTGILVFFIQKKALTNSNPNVFIRSIMSGMLIKMFTTVIAVFAYVIAAGKGFDKKAVFISLFLYLIYLAAEVIAISQQNKKRNVQN